MNKVSEAIIQVYSQLVLEILSQQYVVPRVFLEIVKWYTLIIKVNIH